MMSCKTRRTRGRATGGCKSGDSLGSHPRLEIIVRDYVALHREKANDELIAFRNEPSLKAALKRAGMAKRPDGKRYDHQRRLPAIVLRKATAELLRAPLTKANDFNNLHRCVKNAISSIRGVGELMIYDTSLRVGAKLGLLPERVYLHSGTRHGARALGLNWRAEHLEVRECPREFHVLSPHEIEDCICIYKDRLKSAI